MNPRDLSERVFAYYRNDITRMLVLVAIAVCCTVASLLSFWLKGEVVGRLEIGLFLVAGTCLFVAVLQITATGA